MAAKHTFGVGLLRRLHSRFRSVFFMQGVLSLCLAGYLVIRTVAAGVAAYDILIMGLFVVSFLALCIVQLRWVIVLSHETADHIETIVFFDALTEVYNYRYMYHRLTEEVSRARRHNRPLSVIYLDLDHFKRVNDLYGHQAGNDVLHHVAGLLKSNARTVDLVGRLGGDEFFIVLPDTEVEGATMVAERFRRAVAGLRYKLDGGNYVDFLRVSIGIAAFPVNGGDADTLLVAADRAMYSAKKAGGDTVESATVKEPVAIT